MTADRLPGPTPEPRQPARPQPVAPDAIAFPLSGDLVLLIVALTAVATSGPLIAATAVPALAIAFWRTAMASVVLAPIALVRVRAEIRALAKRDWSLCLLAGALLAGHFATWVPSISLTSVASSTALVATQPIWAALLARVTGRQVRSVVWLGIGVSVTGAALLTGTDVALSGRAVAGDLLATIGGMLAAAYVTAGAAVRAKTSTTAYTAICYSTCAALLLLLCLATGQRLGGYSGGSWMKLAALTVGAQLLGHSLFNVLLRSTSPTALSLAILFEAPGATLIAAVWLHQVPPATAIPGLLMLLAGIAVVVGAGTRAMPAE